MKKHAKTIIIVSLMVALGLGYFYYLANRTPSKDATEQSIRDEEIAALTTRDINDNYPESPREVVKFYVRITKAYYNGNVSDENIEKLAKQARLLFDDELKNSQTEADFLEKLKQEISEYKSLGRYISDYKIESGTYTQYKKMNGAEYASIKTLYYIREGSNLNNTYTKFVLRKDSEGRWKLLYWELADESDFD